MDFKQPVAVYTAATNLDAHLIVVMLDSKGIAAYAVEDNSGVSLWAFGTISQFHRPKIMVEKSDLEKAAELIEIFEKENQQRREQAQATGEIEAVCEECGKPSSFPTSLDGTTQECPHCHAYLDVGEFSWDVDVGEPEE